MKEGVSGRVHAGKMAYLGARDGIGKRRGGLCLGTGIVSRLGVRKELLGWKVGEELEKTKNEPKKDTGTLREKRGV